MRFVKQIALGIGLGVTLMAATLAGNAQQAKSPVTTAPSADSAAPHNWTTEQILTCTVSDCWQLAGKNETTFFDIVQQLTQISAQTRGITLPDDAAAGSARESTSRRRRRPIVELCSMPLWMVRCDGWGKSRLLRLRLRSRFSFAGEGRGGSRFCLFLFVRVAAMAIVAMAHSSTLTSKDSSLGTPACDETA